MTFTVLKLFFFFLSSSLPAEQFPSRHEISYIIHKHHWTRLKTFTIWDCIVKNTSQKLNKLHWYHRLRSYNRPSICVLGSDLFTTLINILSRTEDSAADYLTVPFPTFYQSSPCFLKESHLSSKHKYQNWEKQIQLRKKHFFILLKLPLVSCL